MGYRTIYVRQRDETFWERAEAMAKRKGQPFSRMLNGLVRDAVLADSAGGSVGFEPKKDIELEGAVEQIREVLVGFRKDGEES
jgi:hypothetical protein